MLDGDLTTGIGDGEIGGHFLEADFTIRIGVLDMLGDGELTTLIFTDTPHIDTIHIDTILTGTTLTEIQDSEEELLTTVAITDTQFQEILEELDQLETIIRMVSIALPEPLEIVQEPQLEE